MTSPSSIQQTSFQSNVSRETLSTLDAYVALLLKWNPKINLVGKTTEYEIWGRHVEDALQLLPLLPNQAKTLVDLGSGGGLPGLILAIARPDLAVTLVEIDQRKSAFLKEAVRILGLSNVTVEARDLQTITQRFDIVTSRALASLVQLCDYAKPLLAEGGICLFPKGEKAAAELAEAGDKWRLKYTLKTSTTSDKASIITITELSRTEDGK